ncbi:MAG: hypothetical protein AAB358_03545 [Patescibacteria group bacterium]
MTTDKPILVIGSHRSGSTWIGKMISSAKGVVYLSEPFNPKTGLKIFTDWFTYISEKNQDKYLSEIKKLLKFRGGYRLNLPALKYWATGFMLGEKRPLLKDPIASLSADWLAKNFNLEVLVIIRHPVAFYASLKRVNWRFDFENFLKQKDLMADYLFAFADEMKKPDKSFAEEAGLLWLYLNYVLDKFIQKNPDWVVKRHEDISLNPLVEFKDIYQKFSLEFTPEIEQVIKIYSSDKNPIDVSSDKSLVLERDSRSLIKNWKKHISEEEISTIKKITSPVADKYYQESDW